MADRLLILALAVLSITGCTLPGSNAADTPLPAAQVISSAIQCNGAERQPVAIHIGNQPQLERVMKRMQGLILPAPVVQIPEIDFSRWHVLYISSGQQPTAGYLLRLAEPAFETGHSEARLNVILEHPPADAMVAAVLTHPCILVKIPANSYSAVEIHGLGEVRKVTVGNAM